MSLFNHCFPVHKYDTMEYSQVKAITVLVCLQIFFVYVNKYQQAF
jgi:hypothetical protein